MIMYIYNINKKTNNIKTTKLNTPIVGADRSKETLYLVIGFASGRHSAFVCHSHDYDWVEICRERDTHTHTHVMSLCQDVVHLMKLINTIPFY